MLHHVRADPHGYRMSTAPAPASLLVDETDTRPGVRVTGPRSRVPDVRVEIGRQGTDAAPSHLRRVATGYVLPCWGPQCVRTYRRFTPAELEALDEPVVPARRLWRVMTPARDVPSPEGQRPHGAHARTARILRVGIARASLAVGTAYHKSARRGPFFPILHRSKTTFP